MSEQQTKLIPINEEGRAHMVDISDKASTARMAKAETVVKMNPETLQLVKNNQIAKGNVLTVAQVADIRAAKNTAQWIPMSHSLALTGVDIVFRDNQHDEITVEATVKTTGQTGAEMEALTAVSVAALTIRYVQGGGQGDRDRADPTAREVRRKEQKLQGWITPEWNRQWKGRKRDYYDSRRSA